MCVDFWTFLTASFTASYTWVTFLCIAKIRPQQNKTWTDGEARRGLINPFTKYWESFLAKLLFSALHVFKMSRPNKPQQWKQTDPVKYLHNSVVWDAELKKRNPRWPCSMQNSKKKRLYFGTATHVCTDLSFKPKQWLVSTVKATEGSLIIFRMLSGWTHIFF